MYLFIWVMYALPQCYIEIGDNLQEPVLWVLGTRFSWFGLSSCMH